MKLFQIITAKELANIQNCHLNTAYADLKEIKEHFKISKVKFIHYLLFDRIIKPVDILLMSDTKDLEKLKNQIMI